MVTKWSTFEIFLIAQGCEMMMSKTMKKDRCCIKTELSVVWQVYQLANFPQTASSFLLWHMCLVCGHLFVKCLLSPHKAAETHRHTCMHIHTNSSTVPQSSQSRAAGFFLWRVEHCSCVHSSHTCTQQYFLSLIQKLQKQDLQCQVRQMNSNAGNMQECWSHI